MFFLVALNDHDRIIMTSDTEFKVGETNDLICLELQDYDENKVYVYKDGKIVELIHDSDILEI